MRYYLDTNIVIFLLRDRAELCPDVRQLVYDYANELLTSSVCVQELIHLCQIGKFDHDRRGKRLRADEVLDMVSEAGVGIVPVDVTHLRSLATLPIVGVHRDPNDRLIVAQAIADHIALISSDGRFFSYEKEGLDFIYNVR